jgi:hypothetical protein
MQKTVYACQAIVIPETNGVPNAYCDAPCAIDYCKKHEYLNEFNFELIDPDTAYDLENEREWNLA